MTKEDIKRLPDDASGSLVLYIAALIRGSILRSLRSENGVRGQVPRQGFGDEIPNVFSYYLRFFCAGRPKVMNSHSRRPL